LAAWRKRKRTAADTGRVGGFGEAARDRHDRPNAGEVAQGGEQGDVGLEEAQRAHGIGHGAAAAAAWATSRRELGEARLGRRGERCQQARRMALDQAGEIR
jgi:hypothetical protein